MFGPFAPTVEDKGTPRCNGKFFIGGVATKFSVWFYIVTCLGFFFFLLLLLLLYDKIIAIWYVSQCYAGFFGDFIGLG
jgi:hypothetical protein